jgi:predicted nucleotidyltransferase component of viral defense system
VKARCQRIERNPRRSDRTLPTYSVKVGFQLPGDRYYQNFEEKPGFSEVVVLEISLNDVLCETIEQRLSPTTRPIRACSLEDILAEKLRALLQQPIRNRNRPQDVYDIASRTTEPGALIDVEKVSEFLVRKCEPRGIAPRKSSYDESVQRLARQMYDQEIEAQAADFIPFDQAWAEVLAFVGRLSIPD